MGTTAEKLKYLNETKAEIKNALETPYNVMRDYPELIKKYIDNQPTKVVTDGICGNAVDVPVKAIEINGNIRQETTEGYNLFDKSTANTGKAIDASGNLATNSRIVTSDFIEVEANTNYFCSNVVGSNLARSTASYDENKTLIEIKSLQNVDKGDFKLLTPLKTKYIRVSCLVDDIDVLQVAKSTDLLPYEPYTGGIPSPNPDYPQEITNVGGYDNIFDKNNIISGSYVSDGNGAFVSNSTSKRTDYIEIQANSYYYIYSDKTSGNWGAWYDKDKKFISGITLGGQKEGVVNSPANAKYIAFTISYQGNLTDYSKIKINETAIKIKQSGKNLYNQENFLNANNWIKNTDGYYTGAANNLHIYINNNKNYIVSNFKENTQYSISLKGYSDSIGGNFRFVFKYTDGTSSMNYILNTITESDYRVISQQGKTISYITINYSSSRTLYIKDFMLKEVNIGNEYYEPYHEPIITPINLQGNILSKAGDVKDILKVNRNGEVEIKKNIGKLVLTGEEVLIDSSSTSTRKWWGINFSNYGIYQYNDPTKVCDVLTTKFKSRPQQGSFLPGQVALMTGKKNVYFIFEPDTTEEQARAILTDMPVYFRLAEPQTIKLSSISPIELWQGTNIFKLITNLDTDFEVEYVVDKDSVTKEEE